jgi:hypothetical protein
MAAGQRSGYERAYWMGRRMSVTPSCASTVPSTNSTMECTTDCGWMSTSTRSALTPNSQRASMTSRPLFMRVAESMVILRPMLQVGWFKASWGVTWSKVSRGRLRKGPPEAVSTSRRTSSGRRPSRHWCSAQCSLSMGSRWPPRARACATISSPAITSVSLLARATSLPASSAR